MLAMASAARDRVAPRPFPFSPLSRRRSHAASLAAPEPPRSADPSSSAKAAAGGGLTTLPRARTHTFAEPPGPGAGNCAYCCSVSPRSPGRAAPRQGGGLFEANFQPCPVCCELFKMTLLSPDAAELKGSCRAAWAGPQDSPSFEQRLKRLELDMALVPEGQEASDAAGKRLKEEWRAEEQRLFQDFLALQVPQDAGASRPFPNPESVSDSAEELSMSVSVEVPAAPAPAPPLTEPAPPAPAVEAPIVAIPAPTLPPSPSAAAVAAAAAAVPAPVAATVVPHSAAAVAAATPIPTASVAPDLPPARPSEPPAQQPTAQQPARVPSGASTEGRTELPDGAACDLCQGPLSFQMVQAAAGTVLDGVYLENCCHVLCRACTTKTIIADAQAPSRACSAMRCPLCPNTVVSPADLQAILPAADYDRLLMNELHCLVAGDANFTKCPTCNVIIERDHRPVTFHDESEPEQYALDGVPCSKEAFLHHNEQRFRCRECDTQFCAECSAIPYHTGKTCKEFKTFQVARHCRYCEEPITETELPTRTASGSRRPSLLSFLTQSWDRPQPPAVCSAPECKERAATACPKVLRCGHFCCGVRDEQTCLPCLEPACSRRHPRQSGADFCAICYTEVLSAAPCIQLGCKHVFHVHCLNRRLTQRWPGPRISFNFMNCPSCGVEMKHPTLGKQMKAANQFKDEVVRQAKQRMVFEGLDKCAAVTEKGSPYYRQALKYAMDQLCFYQCFTCRKPYFGGFRSCEDMADDVEEEDGGYEPGDLICGGCVPNQNRICCNVHGTEFIEYKCKFCCNIAQWYCWGTTHFCTSCHRLQERGEYVTKKPKDELPRCPGRKKCPCRVDHPPNGTEYALGCAICRHSTAAMF